MPVYNAAKYIAHTLDSLLAQSAPLHEIIVIDDRSTDNTGEIVRSGYGDRVKYVLLPENKGVSNARNRGVELAQTDYILFMDGDDVAHPQLVEKSLERIQQLEQDTGLAWHLSHSAYELINEQHEIVSAPIRWRQVPAAETLGYQFVRNHIISASGVVVQKAAFLAQGGFRTDFSLSEDVELWTRLAHHSGYAYVDEVLVHIRRHPENASRNLTAMLGAEQRIYAQYSNEQLHEAIFARELPVIQNAVDFVSVLYRLDKWEAGYSALQHYTEQGADDGRYYFYRALYYLKQEAWEEAEADFVLSEQRAPQQGATQNNLGVLAVKNGDRQAAARYFARALEQFPAYMDALHNQQLLTDTAATDDSYRFTWRELRPVLTTYSEK